MPVYGAIGVFQVIVGNVERRPEEKKLHSGWTKNSAWFVRHESRKTLNWQQVKNHQI
jgi:hypothetical protein